MISYHTVTILLMMNFYRPGAKYTVLIPIYITNSKNSLLILKSPLVAKKDITVIQTFNDLVSLICNVYRPMVV